MSKKNKKNSKINQKIKYFFDGDPFDIGVERMPSSDLSDLFHSIGVYDIVHQKPLMLKTIRMIWSDADNTIRKHILEFFKNNNKIYRSDKEGEIPHEREEKIEFLLSQLDVSKDEASKLREIFSNLRSKKITIEKMESKLKYVRFENKKSKLAHKLEGAFDIDDCFEFNAPFIYKLFDQTFHKILTIRTKRYSVDFLKDEDFDEIVKKIELDKQQAVLQKQKNIDDFLKSIKYPHLYLSMEEILNSLRASPPDSKLTYPLLSKKILYKIISKKIDILRLNLFDDSLLLVLSEKFISDKPNFEVPYELELYIELDGLLEEIWKGKKFDFDEVLKDAKVEYENEFSSELDELFDECKRYASALRFDEMELKSRVLKIALENISLDLHISKKMHKIITKRFVQSIKKELHKKQIEELLARTIRDFKNLFPIARGMRRKLILHIGPTNSGKTYEAMQKLQSADTGYYLAPLRLLALEGYENLKELGLDSSLITGEEQIIDDDATHISSTIEMLNYDVDVDVCVIDEVQMLDDRDRGWAWANAIIGAPAKEVIMTGSSNVKEAIIAIAEYLGEELEIVEFERKTPLTLLKQPTQIKDVKSGTAIIAFSRRDVLKLKQIFSPKFKPSIIYGNLSPEVRREEAKKFREGKSDILIATDAIAMGMNLPIETILFSKAQKFDGVINRDLVASEVQQISGRAGRYGLNKEGFVGALDMHTLKIITKEFKKEPKSITAPFKVMANLEHIKLVSSILNENSLEVILTFFIKNMKFNGPFYAASLDDMFEAAKIVDSYELDIATKYHLSCAPLNMNSPYILLAFEGFARSLEKKEPIHYYLPKLHGKFAVTADELLRAEDMAKEITLYLWLSYRFKEYFVDASKANESRYIINSYIERSLHQHLLQRCKNCGVALPKNSKYKICEKCFKKHKRGFRSR